MDKLLDKTSPPAHHSIKENSAEIISGGQVFYNPVQEFNRDLSVSVLNVYFKRIQKERLEQALKKNKKNNESYEVGEEKVYIPGQKYEDGMRILEALSATGLRSIRYAKEIAGVREIIANDLSQKAVESIKENIKHNNVEHLITPSHANAMTLMYLSTEYDKRFDAIDLDPYGCPNMFLDGAIQSIRAGGLLLVTATDMAVLAGNTPEACFVKYGSVPLRNKSCHEMALRILLRAIEGHANRYGKYIEPLLCASADFYIRIFVRVHVSQATCKYSICKQSMIYQCTGCDTLTLQPLGVAKPNPSENAPDRVKFGLPTGPQVGQNCSHCGHKHHLGGPIWSAPIHDKSFVRDLLDEIQKEPLSELGTNRRLVGMLSVIEEELDDVPLYYSLDKLCCVVKLEIMPILKFRSALLHAGYKVSFSHACKSSIKTNAPPSVVWDILRCWNATNPVKKERMLDGTPVKEILGIPPKIQYELNDIHPDANPDSRKNALSRFPGNPTAHWGPGTRATIMIGEDKILKSFKNQNKNKKQKSTSSPMEEGEEQQRKHLKLEEEPSS
ncbi:tRNA (guanine(26)-N(2))-dimethyltransferase [Episyrphus balteatus]|uniref:tRNA (guanine(26)-N(2))-dimethyltransferase n=1 Tax=Episyrphus balteatus TaxID=286459 RepID=UPI002486ADFB|nr:tRNA (guanine(26)-N(2))-dimethyltransferase [Episyrphus balteatus]